MKSTLLSFTLLFFLTVSHAQNWAPINSTEQFNYSLGDTEVITHSIKVDSTHVIEGDSVFYLNRVIAPCDSCIDSDVESNLYSIGFFEGGGLTWERNQPQYLGLEVMTNGEDWVFSDSVMNFTLKPQEPILSTWQFSEGINALITEETEQLVFGELDSIKFIYLSGGQIIELSKNHGLLSFPDLAGNDEYVLKGIEERELGTALPDFHSVYDFEVGDTFLFHEYSRSSTDSPGQPDYSGYSSSGLKKQTVTEVLTSEDSVVVTYNILSTDTISISQYSSTLNENFVPVSTSVSYQTDISIQNIIYTREEYEYLNRIPLSSDGSSFSFKYDIIEDERVIQYRNGYNVFDYDYSSSDQFMKAYDLNYSFEEGYIISGNEQLLQQYIYSLFWSPEVDFGSKAYSDGLGNISSSGSSYDPGYNNGSKIWPSQSSDYLYKLLAYEKANGQTGGTMLSDSEVLSVSENEAFATNLEIYPNPASEHITLVSTNQLASVSVFSQIGEEVLQINLNGNSHRLNIEGLSSGVYVAKVTSKDGRSYSERFVKE
ncbi:MAG: T9SS type A sorting domain-containing protein [Flavobacteriales bacterium]